MSEENQEIPLPLNSRELYKGVYSTFKKWMDEKNHTEFDEDLILIYFDHLSKNYAPSTLWSKYSMLRSTIACEHNIDISKYERLRAFLKEKNFGYIRKESKIFTDEEILKFMTEAPDRLYLSHKVFAIMALCGCLRKSEMYEMKLKDILDNGRNLVVTIPVANKDPRVFAVDDEFYYSIYKKYASIRPARVQKDNFFLKYQNGKCHNQVIGKDKMSSIPKEMAKFLGIPEADQYTGYALRRSTSTTPILRVFDFNTPSSSKKFIIVSLHLFKKYSFKIFCFTSKILRFYDRVIYNPKINVPLLCIKFEELKHSHLFSKFARGNFSGA